MSMDPLKTEVANFSKVEIKMEEPELDDIKVEEPDLESFLPTDYEILQQSYKQLLQRTTDLENELCSSKSIITELRTKVKLLENELQNTTSTLEKEIMQNSQLKAFAYNNKVLSRNQMNFAVYKNGEMVIVWGTEDLTKALTIRYLSMPCHRYLTGTLKYPLPFTLSLQKWMLKIDMHHGVLSDVLDIMRIAALTMTNEEKTIVLHIDEMKVNSLYEYDEIHEEVIGPNSHMQIIMAQSLFSDWKQPVYIDFDKKLTTNILMDLIKRLYEVTYTVVACVSDYTGVNLKLCRELEVSTEKTHFLHPITYSKIYYFADAPQLLLSMHNWFSKIGFSLEDGTYVHITAETLKYCVVDTSHGEKMQHRNLKNINIARATDLFSETCAAVLKTSDTLLARNTGKFIEKISFWFKLMNASNTNPSKNNSYGCDLKFQSKELDSIYDMVKNMRCKRSNFTQLFQNGILISTTSLKELFKDIKQKYPSKQIETHRLNLNSLNDLMSKLKNLKHDHNDPSPLQAVNRIRDIVLTEQYFLAEILKRADIDMSCEIKKGYVIETDLTSSLSSKTDNEEDTLLYLADLIAKKYAKDYPELSKQSSEENEHNYAIHLNFPQLNGSKASVKFLKQAYLMDEVFVQFHPKGGLVSGKNVTEKLFYFMKKRCGNMVPEEILRAFIKQRTILRIKYANAKQGVNTTDLKRKSPNEENISMDKRIKL